MVFFKAASILLCSIILQWSATANPTIVLPGGSILYGTTTDGVEQYLNIPFGHNTEGSNRFRPPKALTLRSGLKIDGTKPGASCPQATNTSKTPIRLSEDCLNLRIARPSSISLDVKLPVLIFIPGGGFAYTSIYDDSVYNPVGFVRQSVDNGLPAIYAAVNYRVNIFGFAAAPILAMEKSTNVGLRDQRLGIEWIKEHIRLFGGDPDDITLFGESAGADSVGLQMVAYGGTKPAQFSKAILDSGGADSFPRMNSNLSTTRFAEVCSRMGCLDDNTSFIDHPALSCMRSIPMPTLLSVQEAYAANIDRQAGAILGPVIDGDFLPKAPSVLIATGQFSSQIPIIQGWNEDDGSLFTPPTILDDQDVTTFLGQYFGITNVSTSKLLAMYPTNEFRSRATPDLSGDFFRAARITRDIMFTCPAMRFSKAVARQGTNAYLFELNQTAISEIFPFAQYGVSHTADLIYAFNEVKQFSTTPSSADIQLASQISGSWSAFMATGNPSFRRNNYASTVNDWPLAYSGEYSSGSVNVKVLGGPDSGSTVLTSQGGQGPLGMEKIVERCAFIETLLDELQV